MRVVSFPEESNFTEEMRTELLLLRQQLVDDLDGPDFPWDRYEELHREERLHAPASRYVTRDNQQEQVATAQELPQEVQEPPQEEHEPGIPVSLPKLLTPSEPAQPSPKKPVVVPSLESLCKGDEEQSKHYAAKIDSIWDSVKSEIRESDYSTACTAVYKLAEWLGLVHEGIKAREWVAMLQSRYGVSVTEGVSKYTIARPTSIKFKTYVLMCFKLTEQKLALLTKKKPLPPGVYQ